MVVVALGFWPGCDSNKGPVFKQGDLYGLESGALSFAVDPHGARIVDVHLAGAANLLTGPAANPTNFGSTFWTSPQSRWGWPPPSAFDTDAYMPSTTDARIAFDGPTATALGVRMRKQFGVDVHRAGRIAAEYQIAATDDTGSSVAPWEISRVPAGGLTFFGTGLTAPTAGGGFALPPTQDAAGCTWLDDRATPIPTTGSRPDQKLLADGTGGWLAHVDGDVLLLKQFPDLPPGMAAPGEAEIEIFVQGAGAYVEIEEQGPYQTLAAAGQTLTWDVAWLVARLPPGLAVRLGNPDLVSFVQQMLMPQ